MKLQQLTDDVLNLKLQARNTPGTTTLHDYYSEKVNTGSSFFAHADLTVTEKQLPSTLFKDIPQGSESSTVQPWWGNVITSINEWLKKVESSITFLDTHKKRILDGKEPDGVGLRKGGSEDLFNIVLVIELKGEGLLDNAAKGQIIYYLELVMFNQPYRSFVYGVLTDNKDIYVLKCSREEGNLKFQWITSIEVSPESLARIFSFFAFSSLDTLGYSLPDVGKVVKLTGFLGSGSSSNVYKGLTKQNEVVVVKVYKDHHQGKRDKEVKILQRLSSQHTDYVPCLVGIEVPDNVLVMKPYAKHFSNSSLMNRDHIKKMVHTLRMVHSIKVIHGDIRHTNIFYTTESDPLLADWGCSVENEFSTKLNNFEGAILGSKTFLQSFIDCGAIKRRTNDDLHALAQTIYLLFFPLHKPDCVGKLDESSLTKIIRFWDDRGSVWKEIFQLADKADPNDASSYDTFTEKLCSFF